MNCRQLLLASDGIEAPGVVNLILGGNILRHVFNISENNLVMASGEGEMNYVLYLVIRCIWT